MEYLLKTGLLMLLAGFIHANHQTRGCPELDVFSRCKCSHAGTELTTVHCRNITNLMTLKKEIKEFRHHHVDYLKLSNLNLPYFPAGLFLGTSIDRLILVNISLGNPHSPENATLLPFQGLENSITEVHIRNMQVRSNAKDLSNWYWQNMKHFKKLRTLVIQNTLTNFVGHNFAEIGGGSLEIITVRQSQVNRIHPQAFQDLTNLISADFNGNYLPYLVRTMFPNPAPKLEILDFSDNRLFTLNENMFENMPALTFLDISRNDFKKFESVVFSSLWNQLQFFSLSDNPFQCDCTLIPLKERLLSGSLPTTNDVKEVTCINYGDFKKTKLKDLNTSSLPCY